ncbi:MAG TPA: hypothetical protein VN793_00550 [Acidimicrobiales bacterium]|nr:hypothetical protein [Acidimicrobiales bacterium]
MSYAPLSLSAIGTSDAGGNLTITFAAIDPGLVFTGSLLIDNAPASMTSRVTVDGVPWGPAIGSTAIQVQARGPRGVIQITSTTATPLTMFTAWITGSMGTAAQAAEVGYAYPFPAAPASGALVTFVGAGAMGAGDGAAAHTHLVLAMPGGMAIGDLAIAFVVAQNSINAITPAPPAGWTSLVEPFTGVGGEYAQVLYRIIDGTETATYTWTLTAANPSASLGQIIGMRGGGVNVVATGTFAVTPVTAFRIGALVIECWMGLINSGSTGNPPITTNHNHPTTQGSANQLLVTGYVDMLLATYPATAVGPVTPDVVTQPGPPVAGATVSFVLS